MIRERIAESGIVPVVTLREAGEAVDLAGALLSGGVSVIEVMFRSGAAAEGIRRITEELPDVLVGAGTVRSVEQLETALEAGAEFIVTPGFGRKVVESAVKRHIPVYPGVMTPGEIEKAVEYGMSLLKFFPAEAAGGTATLKAFAGPYPDVSFIPTGGVNAENFEAYLALPNVIAAGGSWLTKVDQTGKRDLDLLTRRASEARERLSSLRAKNA